MGSLEVVQGCQRHENDDGRCRAGPMPVGQTMMIGARVFLQTHSPLLDIAVSM